MPIIEVEAVTKTYRARSGGRALVGRGGLGDLLRGRRSSVITALKGVSFSVDPGESLGIIGANGSGKSTLLKIIAGVTVPTTGTVRVYGRVASLLELGAGFHPMLTGRENIYLNAGILGMRHAEVAEKFEEIVKFSGIGDFIDNPVDTYSSGMYVRVAFAVAAFTNPEVFLIDEVLSVGDEEFQRKCRRRIGELMEQGNTIVFVSHDLGIVNTLCNRVVLLSGGEMIVRDSPKKTIDFYLRQVGASKGLHTFSQGPVEVTVSNGRISVFHEQNEVTAPAGFQFKMVNLGQWHSSMDADWEIVERSSTGCLARGRLPKLPVVLVWRIGFEDGDLTWDIAFECEREAHVDSFELNLFFPLPYSRFLYDDDSGSFPELSPEDVNWTVVVAPELLCEEAALLTDEGSALPPVLIALEGRWPHLRGFMGNTDYMTGCRVLQAWARLVDEGEPLSAGRHEVLTARFKLGQDPDAVAGGVGRRGARRTLEQGRLKARFERGWLRLFWDDVEVTSQLHVYASLLIGNLWNDSTQLRWETFEREENLLRIGGVSRRFPFGMVWEVGLVAGGLSVEIWLDALDDLSVQEYHTSVMLASSYAEWETEHESGRFPAFASDEDDWRHINRDYGVGGFARAWGEGVPDLRLEVNSDREPVRMTVINTGIQQRSRVLQALRTPERELLHLEKGRHGYFSGRILVGKT